MGGEGSMMQAIHSLRNNSRRSQREAYDGWSTEDRKGDGIKAQPVTEDQLQAIRDKLKKQRQVLFRKRLLAYVLIITLIIGGIAYWS